MTEIPHGTRSAYTNYGCRCADCTGAQRVYSREYYRANVAKRTDATEASEQVACLKRNGHKLRSLAALTGMSISNRSLVSRGIYPTVNKHNAALISRVHDDELERGGSCTCYSGLPVRKLTGKKPEDKR